jgi:hypothetical protein
MPMEVQNGLMTDEPRLSPEDQAKVDEFVSSGINAVERKPFRPIRLLFILIAVVSSLSVLSLLFAHNVGVY